MSENLENQIREIITTVETLFEPGQVVELRGMGGKRQYGAFFVDPEEVAKMAAVLGEKGCNCYIGLAPRIPKTCIPTGDLVGKKGRTGDVLKRRWLLVDVDPQRPGTCCSTETEKASAKSILDNIVQHLAEAGWPKPLIADSGNGYHALYRVDLPVDDGDTIKRCLYALAEKFDTSNAKVDTGVHDAARIIRLYGTLNRKGESTSERPHRQAKILEQPDSTPVPLEKLGQLAKLAPQRVLDQQSMESADIDLGDHNAEATAEKINSHPSYSGTPLTSDVIIQKAKQWTKRQKLAISGNGGSNQTFYVACGLVVDWGLSAREALPIMNAYNERLEKGQQEVWEDHELSHYLDCALQQVPKQPGNIGKYLLPNKKVGESNDGKQESTKEDKPSQTEILSEIINELELWHNEDETPFATVRINGTSKNIRVASTDFKYWLGNAYFQTQGLPANETCIKSVIATTIGRCKFAGRTEKTFVRVGGKEERIYIDLGDDQWRCIEVSKSGWRIIQDPPVKFRRVAGQKALPQPEQDGSIADLRHFLNVQGFEDTVLILCWLVGCFQPDAEYPLLVFNGQQGTGKSTAARMTRALVCPNEATLRSAPKNEEDFAVEAVNSWIVVLDNLSWIPDWLSDSLCRLATGGAVTKRALYTDSEQSILRFCGPAILNGITDLANRPDLLDRCLLIELSVLEKTKPKKLFWSEFEKMQGKILGGIFNAVVYALGNPTIVDDLPRMAGFAQWAIDAEPELARQWNALGKDYEDSLPTWTVGDFLKYYRENIEKASSSALDQNPIASYLLKLIDAYGKWEGSATELFTLLNDTAKAADDTTTIRSQGWPKNAASLSRQLQRLAPTLNRRGITAERYRKSGGNRDRVWSIRNENLAVDKRDDSVKETIDNGNIKPIGTLASKVEKVTASNLVPMATKMEAMEYFKNPADSESDITADEVEALLDQFMAPDNSQDSVPREN